MLKLIAEYCSISSIHGFRYLSERRYFYPETKTYRSKLDLTHFRKKFRRRHWTERCWWAVAIGLSIWVCTALIQNIWIKWRDTPVQIQNAKRLPISRIPFPTVTIPVIITSKISSFTPKIIFHQYYTQTMQVTICPETKTHRSKLDLERLYDVPKELWNISDVE